MIYCAKLFNGMERVFIRGFLMFDMYIYLGSVLVMMFYNKMFLLASLSDLQITSASEKSARMPLTR